MSLIIEDKNALDNLANTIIGANGSVDKTTATKDELMDIINGIIPLKSKFASGVFTPATEISIENMPEISFALGNDENNNIIVPDMILIYQPQGIVEGTGNVNAAIFTMLKPKLVRSPEAGAGVYYSEAKNTSNNLITGAIGNANYEFTRLTDKSFFIAPKKGYIWQAKKPIVWLQIKLVDELKNKEGE